jgi:glycosyltransferase involved in cell wall biosynthesis
MFINTLQKLTISLIQEPLDAARKAHKFGWQLICSLALAYRIRNQNITHIHAHMGHVPTTVAWLLALQLRLPFSFTGHAADLFRHRCLLKTKLRSASFVSCISLWHRNYYASILPGSALKYPLIRCGVDSTQFSPVSTTKRNCYILSVGRLVEKKGFDILLKAFAKLRDNGSKLGLLIGGDGPEFNRLSTLRTHLNLESSVHFLGALSHEEVKKLLPDATLFVLPCRIESSGDRDGIPVVLMEAMAVGVPCVSGDLPAIRELITDGHTGKLVSSEDAEVWANTISQLLGNPTEQKRYSQNGRKWVESEFSSQVNIPRLIAAYEGVHAR